MGISPFADGEIRIRNAVLAVALNEARPPAMQKPSSRQGGFRR
jgi:hypothetical protein